MPPDLGVGCKKRHHPDGFHASTSFPKRHLSIHEAELHSSICSLSNSTLPTPAESAHGSSPDFPSAAITPDSSLSMCAVNSTASVSAVTSRAHSSVFQHSQSPSNAASYRMQALQIPKSGASCETKPPFQLKRDGVWAYCSPASKFAENAPDSECSEVTYVHPSASTYEPNEASGSKKVTHIISRREKSSLDSKWGMDEDWVKAAYGSDAALRGKWWQSNCSFFPSLSGRKGLKFPLPACESGCPCTTRDSQEVSDIHGSDCKDSFVASPLTHASFVAPWVQARSENLDFCNRRHVSIETDSQSSFGTNGIAEDLSPSYILSSGRLSLEEEARLGRRARTIDDDFEEYFSSLMLK